MHTCMHNMHACMHAYIHTCIHAHIQPGSVVTRRRARTDKGEGASDARDALEHPFPMRGDTRCEHPFPMRGDTRRRPTARRAIDIIDGPQHTTCDFSYLDVQFTRNFSHSDVNNASRSSHVLCPPVGDREEAPEHKKTEQEMVRLTCLLTYLLTCLLAYLLAYLLACLLTYLLAYLLTCLLT